MNCRNWECGVIVPIINEKETNPSRQGKGKGKEPETRGSTPSTPLPVGVFNDTVPIPMRIPAVPLSQDRKPFFYGT